MDKTPSDFIDIGRRFRPHDESKAAETAAAESYLDTWGTIATVGWEKLIEKEGVHIVLGEAGSGRTYEFKAKANALRASGETAFFISLHRLSQTPLSRLLDISEVEQLEAWLKGGHRAFFFLDAVDESKLTRNSQFREALDALGKVISPAVSRARIFISSRVKDWLPETDRRHVVEAFDLMRPTAQLSSAAIAREAELNEAIGNDFEAAIETVEGTAPKSNLHTIAVWCIAGLNQSGVCRYVQGRGIPDGQAFLQSVSEAYAWELAARPLDVNFLIEFWKKNHRIGKPAEMFEALVQSQLTERPEKSEYDRAFPLAIARARQGVETLAAATIFCRRLDFQIPDDSLITSETAGLNAQACLPQDWQPAEIHALLSRPLFDAAIYGATRFHHRNLAEYLTARWLMKLIVQECPIPEVMDALFVASRGATIARQSRLAVAVWLACIGEEPWVSRVRDRLLESAPEAFFRYGDPSLLNAEFKSQILDAVVQRFGEREVVRIETAEVTLSRLGERGLAQSLVAHLSSSAVSDALKCEFMTLARVARVEAVVPTALSLLSAGGSSSGLITLSMWLVEELGAPADLQAMAVWVRSLPALTCDRCWQAAQMLFPTYLAPSDLAQLFRRLSDPDKASNHLTYSLRHCFAKLDDRAMIGSTLEQLVAMIEEEPHFADSVLSQSNVWLARTISPLFRALLKLGNLSDQHKLLVARGIWLCTQDLSREPSDYGFDDDGEGKKWTVASVTEDHPEVRREVFWLHFTQERQRRVQRQSWHVASWVWSHFLKHPKTTHDDLTWALRDLAPTSSSDRRLGALYVACHYWFQQKKPRALHRQINAATQDSKELIEVWRSQRGVSPGQRLKHWWERQKWDGIRCGYWWERRWAKITGVYWRVRNMIWLSWQRRALGAGKLPHVLVQLIGVNGFDSKWAPKNWDKLTAKHGKAITKATQQGCIAFWPTFDPRHSTSRENSVDNRIIVGLTGLQSQWASGQCDFERWSSDEVAKATRYAIREMNGFSDWLASLAKHQPQPVLDTLAEAMEDDWHRADGTGGIRVVDRLKWSTCGLGKLMASRVFARLQLGDPASSEGLHTVLQMLIRHSDTSHQVYADLAAERTPTYPWDHASHRAWLLIWLQTNTVGALDYLDGLFRSSAMNEQQKRDLVVGLCGSFDSHFDREYLVSNPDYMRPSVAPRFIRWVYQWINEREDIRRGNGSYSPGPRDHAQDFRGSLLGRLADRESIEAETALVSLIAEPQMANTRDYLLHLLDGVSRRLADGESWDAESLRTFESSHTARPQSLADLFRMACRRLQRIKDEVEMPDDIVRNGYVRPGDDEAAMRRYLAMRLTDLSEGYYNAPQESVVNGERRPDLRLQRSGIPGAVPIEVKLADGRSVNSLIADLEGQLAGDYLTNHQSRHGVFVVGFVDPRVRDYWLHPTTSSHLSFQEVVAHLKAHAESFLASQQVVLGLEVVGIDFRPRESARA